MPSPTASEPTERACALARAGQVAQAYGLLEAAIDSGDALAAATLADWRMAGQIVRRDIGAAQVLYGRALELGAEMAAGPYIALMASGAGGAPRDWRAALALVAARRHDPAARRQRQLLDAMELTETGDPRQAPAGSPVAEAPPIESFAAFLTRDECRYLIELAVPRLQPSQVVDPRSGRLVHDPVRTASAAAFPLVIEDPVIHAINRRMAAATGTGWAQGEPVQVLCYRPGEEYKPHSDALPPGEPNQRTLTVLVALNEDYEGGETQFPAIGRSWRGRTGEALAFRNVDTHGSADATARHAGLPVRSGVKFLLSRWIRERPLDLTGPPGKPF